MSLLAHLKREENIEQQEDSLGGGGRQLLPSDLHDMMIEMAYLGEAASGAISVTFWFKSPTGSHRETIYVTSGTAKGRKHYYVDKNSGANKFLPGFVTANDICRLTIDKELFDLEPEEKIVSVWNPKEKKEMPTPVQVITELLGQPIKLGLLKVLEDKNVKNAAGEYVPSGDTRESNQIDKVFHSDTGLTVVEAESGMTEGEFYLKWQETNKDKVRDKTAKDKPKAGAPAASRTATAPAGNSLFPKK
jgi:hypothetical protein